MKNLIALLFILPTVVFGQVKAEKKEMQKVKIQTNLEVKKEVHPLPIRINPEFIGGQSALDKYVADNFKMSRKDRKKEVEGEIKVKFTIAADGTVKNAVIMKGGMSEKLNKEALRVINSMPKWTPGTENGKAVDVLYLYTIKVG